MKAPIKKLAKPDLDGIIVDEPLDRLQMALDAELKANPSLGKPDTLVQDTVNKIKNFNGLHPTNAAARKLGLIQRVQHANKIKPQLREQTKKLERLILQRDEIDREIQYIKIVILNIKQSKKK